MVQQASCCGLVGVVLHQGACLGVPWGFVCGQGEGRRRRKVACMACETTQATSAVPTPASVCKQNPIPQPCSTHLASSPCIHPVPGLVRHRLKAAQADTWQQVAFGGAGCPWGAMRPCEPHLPEESTVLPLPQFPHFPAIGYSSCRRGWGVSWGILPF